VSRTTAVSTSSLAALLCVRTSAVSTSGFSNAIQTNAALCHGQQPFSLAVLAALLTATLLCVTEKLPFSREALLFAAFLSLTISL